MNKDVLLVFYSLSGTGRRAAEALAAMRDWRLAEIVEPAPRTGFVGTLRCVVDSLLRRRVPIHYRGPYPGSYTTVVLISPVWAGRMAAPMRSFIAKHAAELPNVALLTVMGGRGAPEVVAEAGRLLGRSPILSTAFTTREIEDGSGTARLSAFADALHGAQQASAAVRPALWSPQTS